MPRKKEVKKLNLAEALAELDKKYGSGSVINGNELEPVDRVISTGSLSLDIATGIGGIPVSSNGNNGKIVEIFGWESGGKSTITQSVIGNAQKAGIKCLYVDGETSIDEKYSKRLGIDLESMLLIQLDEWCGEGAYDKMFALVETGEIGLVVIDSYNSLQPKKVIDGDVEDQGMGVHARMLGKVVAKCINYCSKYGTTFVFVGQLREKIGVLHGNPETTQGGNALKFYAHMRIRIARSLAVENVMTEESEQVANLHTAKVIKNKMAAPFKKAEFYIRYGVGVEKYKELVSLAHAYEVIRKHGDNVKYEETKYKLGDFMQLLVDNEEFFQEIRSKVLKQTKVKNINNIPDPELAERVIEGITDALIEEEVNSEP